MCVLDGELNFRLNSETCTADVTDVFAPHVVPVCHNFVVIVVYLPWSRTVVFVDGALTVSRLAYRTRRHLLLPVLSVPDCHVGWRSREGEGYRMRYSSS